MSSTVIIICEVARVEVGSNLQICRAVVSTRLDSIDGPDMDLHCLYHACFVPHIVKTIQLVEVIYQRFIIVLIIDR